MQQSNFTYVDRIRVTTDNDQLPTEFFVQILNMHIYSNADKSLVFGLNSTQRALGTFIGNASSNGSFTIQVPINVPIPDIFNQDATTATTLTIKYASKVNYNSDNDYNGAIITLSNVHFTNVQLIFTSGSITTYEASYISPSLPIITNA